MLNVTRSRWRVRGDAPNGGDLDHCRRLRVPVRSAFVGDGEWWLEHDRSLGDEWSQEAGRPRLNQVVGGEGDSVRPASSPAPPWLLSAAGALPARGSWQGSSTTSMPGKSSPALTLSAILLPMRPSQNLYYVLQLLSLAPHNDRLPAPFRSSSAARTSPIRLFIPRVLDCTHGERVLQRLCHLWPAGSGLPVGLHRSLRVVPRFLLCGRSTGVC